MSITDGQFREKSKGITVMPELRAWERIEARLHARRTRRKLLNARIFTLTLLVLCVLAIAIGLFYYAKWRAAQHQSMIKTSVKKEEIKEIKVENIYDVERIRMYHADQKSQN